MEERKVVDLKKEEFAVREYIKTNLGKGKVSRVRVKYTPVGEKIVVATHKPGLVIGRKGEKIEELTRTLRKKFKMGNPHIEIEEIKIPEFDAQIMADDIALALERFGPLKFKVVSYRTLQRIIDAGARGVEIRLSGKLPGARAKPWRFAYGYLKKTGEPSKAVDRAQAKSYTKPGVVGVKVAILSPDVKMIDQIEITDEYLAKLKEYNPVLEQEKAKKKTKKKISKKKTGDKK